MNEEMAEKTIARTIQLLYKSLMQTEEELHTTNSIIDRVAFRDDKPAAEKEPLSKSPGEPQNITDALERESSMSTNVLRDAGKLRNRIDKLF